MLSSLSIRNLAIIKSLEQEFDDGLVVLTGETGAGKSIILDGINLLIGEKLSSDMIRSECDTLSAEGVFSIKGDTVETLEEFDIDCEGNEIIIKREMDRNGKNKISVNGSRITAANLKEIMGSVVDLVGQHSHQMLLEKKYHIKLIDKFLNDEETALKQEIERIYYRYSEIAKKIKELEDEKNEIEKKKELYEFQLKELSEADLIDGETEKLEQEYKKLFNAGKIIENLNKVMDVLKEGDTNVISMMGFSRNTIENISKYGSEYQSIYEKLDSIYYNIEESVYEIEASISDVETNEEKLSQISERLDKLKKLNRKYGKDIPELIILRDSLAKKLENLEYNQHEELKHRNEQKNILNLYKEKSKKISEKRRKIAEDIEYSIVEELEDLNMKGIRFKVSFYERDGINKEGNDIVEFMISTNIGEELKPLSKIVSGGEVSRIMLALKSIFAGIDNISLLIFDEIDTGIGGETLRKIADKLKALSMKVQIICITHSATIAAIADTHFFIKKYIDEGKTVTNVMKLSYEERITEVSRMIAGDAVTENVKKHAEDLIKEGEKWITKK